MAVTLRRPIRIVLALRTDDLVDLALHQLMNDAEAETNAQREQSLPRCSDELAERLLNLRRQRRFSASAVATTCELDTFFMAVPPVPDGLGLATTNAPNRSGRGGRTATQSSTRSRTTSARLELHRTAIQAGVRRRLAPHQLRHAHAVELLHEGIPLPMIQRQLGHSHLSTTGTYLQGISSEEIISTVHGRRGPMMHASAGLDCSARRERTERSRPITAGQFEPLHQLRARGSSRLPPLDSSRSNSSLVLVVPGRSELGDR
jgi:integrase